MSDAHANEALSFIDAFFLYCEQPGAPLNVASISAFEGVIPLEECMEYVASRLGLLPRFVQRPVTACIGPPTWQNDPHFDLRNHVREIRLKHGTLTEWKAAVSGILSTHLERSRPLWEMVLLQGLKSGQTGVVVKCHHCMVDGVAGVAMLNALLDASPVAPPVPHHKKPGAAAAAAAHDPGTALLDGLITSCFATAQALLTAHSELLRMAQQATARSVPNPERSQASAGQQPVNQNSMAQNSMGQGSAAQGSAAQASMGALAQIAPLGGLAGLLSELAQPTERLPYNVLCHGPQKFDWAELPMAEIVAVKQACGTTVNEVVLTVLSMALRRYAELHELNTKGRKLRLVVPVNVRPNGEATVTGNQITFLPVDIPWGVRDPRKFLAVVQERVKFSRTAHGAELVGLLGILLGALPTSLQTLAGSMLSQLPISVCNSICTNVHGPRIPLYLMGHKMLSTYPYVPIGGEMGMNCAVMSYDETLFVGFTGDAKAIPDLGRLAEFFRESFTELREAAGIRIAKKKRAPAKPKIAAGKAAVHKNRELRARKRNAVPKAAGVPKAAVPKAAVVPKAEAVTKAEAVPEAAARVEMVPDGAAAPRGETVPSQSTETAAFA